MSEEASVGNKIHIGPIIDVNNVDKIESNETINLILSVVPVQRNRK